MESQHTFFYDELEKISQNAAFIEQFKTTKETIALLDDWLVSISIIYQKRLNPLEFESFYSMEPGDGILLFLGLKKEGFFRIFLENPETKEAIYILPGDSVLNYPENFGIFFFVPPHIHPQRYRTYPNWREVFKDAD